MTSVAVASIVDRVRRVRTRLTVRLYAVGLSKRRVETFMVPSRESRGDDS